MFSITDTIEIDAPPPAVWADLTDFAAYPTWNPFIPRLEGDAAIGSRLVVEITPPGGRSMRFQPVVTAAVPTAEFRWLGTLGFPGLFDGEHSFTLEPLPGNRTRLTQAETFRGLLTPVLRRMMGDSTRQGFVQMNQSLKQRVEQRPPVAGATPRSEHAA